MKMLFNIDWLEVYCLEPFAGVSLDANYYRACGYTVKVRAYGTRIYNEMFTIKIGSIWAIEIRRNPYKSTNGKQVLDSRSVHIRLTNEACYMQDPIGMLKTFIMRHAYEYQGISRIDICADFTRFAGGVKPRTVVNKILTRKVMRVNKGCFSIHGKESWGGHDVQTLSWGTPNSMVSTKMYNKTQEMKDVKPKVYIQHQWEEAGLIEHNDPTEVWRVEFSIKNRCKKWVRVEDSNGDGIKRKYIRHELASYANKEALAQFFFSLAEFYFKFRIAEYKEDGSLQRKARCKDYTLFNERPEILKPVTEVEVSQPTRTEKVLLNYLTKLETDPRADWDGRWIECVKVFKDIVSQQKLTKEIVFREQLYNQLFQERCTYEYVDFFNSLLERDVFISDPEYEHIQGYEAQPCTVQ